ncbi:uncharacterized protein A4U43_UnF9400 [Asparagus officinalis]|uniref:Uncharacterized protein n=1 Tax=Asparagus officinalis TaxID=4686 RepID=A0A1R3L5Q7_ASPOF|nr:uncharacterized protein A4U43_UnF9400 [Asparagus officinalis]
MIHRDVLFVIIVTDPIMLKLTAGTHMKSQRALCRVRAMEEAVVIVVAEEVVELMVISPPIASSDVIDGSNVDSEFLWSPNTVEAGREEGDLDVEAQGGLHSGEVEPIDSEVWQSV